VQARAQGEPEPQGDVRILGGIGAGAVDGDAVEGDLGLASADQLLDRDGDMTEVALGELVHAVVVQAPVERVAQEHGVVEGGDPDPVAGQHLPVVFDVLADLEDVVGLEHGLERVQHLLQRQLPFGQCVAAKRSEEAEARWPTGM
jgi:hypothetical protein